MTFIWKTFILIASIFFAQNTNFKPQSVLLIQNPVLIIQQNDAYLQILFDRGINCKIGHWICIYYNESIFHVYDSLNCNYLRRQHKLYIKPPFPFEYSIIFENVQPQNCFDCGAFSIAYATSVALNINPVEQFFFMNNSPAYF